MTVSGHELDRPHRHWYPVQIERVLPKIYVASIELCFGPVIMMVWLRVESTLMMLVAVWLNLFYNVQK